MPSLTPVTEATETSSPLSEGTETLTAFTPATETLVALREIIYSTRYLWPGEFYPSQSVTAGNIYPGAYGDKTGLTLVTTSEATETLTPLTEA